MESYEETTQLNLRIPNSVAEELDKVVREKHYKSRQELIYEILRDFFEELAEV